MRVIDLLNKIANGKTPPKIKFKNTKPIFEYNTRNGKYECCYKSNKGKNEICELTFLNLKDEIELIEEDKPIENILVNYQDGHSQEEINEYLRCEINELIDEVNKLKKEKENE